MYHSIESQLQFPPIPSDTFPIVLLVVVYQDTIHTSMIELYDNLKAYNITNCFFANITNIVNCLFTCSKHYV